MFLNKSDFSNVIKNTPMISIDLCVIKNKSILLGERINPPAKKFYFVPGGRIFKNESLEDAFKRISESELGIYRPEESEFIGVFEHMYDDNFLGNNDFSTHYIVLAYKIILNSDISIPQEFIKSQHSNSIWYSFSNKNFKDINIHKYSMDYINNKKIACELNL